MIAIPPYLRALVAEAACELFIKLGAACFDYLDYPQQNIQIVFARSVTMPGTTHVSLLN